MLGATLAAAQASVAQAPNTSPGVAAPAVGTGARQPAQVLVITGTDPYLPAFQAIDGAMRAAMLRRHGRQVAWIYEPIDTARFGRASDPLLAEVLARKYQDVRIDAVVLATSTAVQFHLHHGERLWPGVPAVFHSVAPTQMRMVPAEGRLAGVVADDPYAEAVEVGRSLQAQANRVLVVAGVSDFDRTQLDSARVALAPLASRLPVEFVQAESLRAAADRLARELPTTVVLYTSLFRDAAGHVYTPRDALTTLAASSAVPIYGVFESQLGFGLAAGAFESLRERGERVAALLVRGLDGWRPDRLTLEPPPAARCIADGRELHRFGLDASAIAGGCELRFVEPGFFERYWWQSLLATLAFGAQSALIGALLVQRRRRRRAEAGLVAQRVQLLHASRLAVAGELTASIAHEINQPLGAILSNADAAELLLESGRAERAELMQIVADIRRDDLRASAVIQRLRTLLARHDTERRRFALHRVIEQTAAILHGEATRRGVTIDYRLGAARAEVLGDPVQLQQVLLNLVLNAFDAVASMPEVRRHVAIDTADTPAGVQLTVRDFGSGIAPADLDRLFESFFSTKQRGMGLGLAIARSIVEAHSGTIQAQACEVGAAFVVVLPTAPDDGTGHGSAASAA